MIIVKGEKADCLTHAKAFCRAHFEVWLCQWWMNLRNVDFPASTQSTMVEEAHVWHENPNPSNRIGTKKIWTLSSEGPKQSVRFYHLLGETLLSHKSGCDLGSLDWP